MANFNLEFRNEKGEYLFDVSGCFAQEMFKNLKQTPEFVHTTKKINKRGEFVVLECIKDCGYKMGGVISFTLKKGAYIKCVLE